MFKMIDCGQRNDAWIASRLGKVTGSIVDRVITKTGKASAQTDDLVNRCVAELVMGEPDETFQSAAMLRGVELEDMALDFFNFAYDFEFKKCGFMCEIDEKGNETGAGVSPDGLWLEKGLGLELKCPLAHTHISYLLKNDLPDQYKHQVQMALMVSDFDKWIFGSYHPRFKCLMVEVGRDEKFISAMRPLVQDACAMIKEKFNEISKMVEVAS